MKRANTHQLYSEQLVLLVKEFYQKIKNSSNVLSPIVDQLTEMGRFDLVIKLLQWKYHNYPGYHSIADWSIDDIINAFNKELTLNLKNKVDIPKTVYAGYGDGEYKRVILSERTREIGFEEPDDDDVMVILVSFNSPDDMKAILGQDFEKFTILHEENIAFPQYQREMFNFKYKGITVFADLTYLDDILDILGPGCLR